MERLKWVPLPSPPPKHWDWGARGKRGFKGTIEVFRRKEAKQLGNSAGCQISIPPPPPPSSFFFFPISQRPKNSLSLTPSMDKRRAKLFLSFFLSFSPFSLVFKCLVTLILLSYQLSELWEFNLRSTSLMSRLVTFKKFSDRVRDNFELLNGCLEQCSCHHFGVGNED